MVWLTSLVFFRAFVCVLYKIPFRTPMTCWKLTKLIFNHYLLSNLPLSLENNSDIYNIQFSDLKPVSSRSLFHRLSSKHIVSNLTSQDLCNHFLSPQALLSRRQDHVTQGCHLFRDFLEHQGYLGYPESHRSPEKTMKNDMIRSYIIILTSQNCLKMLKIYNTITDGLVERAAL